MILLNPKQHRRAYRDERSRELMLRTIDFFERKGKRRLKADDRTRIWYADFLEFVKQEGIFATMCTPAGYGAPGSRWDTWRICEFAEILAFYGLQYWYTWQVSVLGLGPIRAARRDEARGAPGGGLHARGVARRPALPPLQPGRQDEGDDAGGGGDRRSLGHLRRQGVREGAVIRDGDARHPRAAEARGHGAREHRAHRQVHPELFLQPCGISP